MIDLARDEIRSQKGYTAMATLSQHSLSKLETCVEPLRQLFAEVVKDFDCTILEGKRTVEQQEKNVASGVSKTMDSRHLDEPLSNAVDVAPYPLKWPKKDSPTYAKDLARYYYFGGFVIGTAQRLNIATRWGGDWDGDRDIHEQSFDDLVHFELVLK